MAVPIVSLCYAVFIGMFRIKLGIDLIGGVKLVVAAHVLAQIGVFVFDYWYSTVENSVVRFTALPGDGVPVRCEIKTGKPISQGGDFFASIRFSAVSDKKSSKRVLLGEFVLDVRRHEGDTFFCEVDPTQPDTLTVQRKIGLLPTKYLAPYSDNEHLLSDIAHELIYGKVSYKEERDELLAKLRWLMSMTNNCVAQIVIAVGGTHVEETLPIAFLAARNG